MVVIVDLMVFPWNWFVLFHVLMVSAVSFNRANVISGTSCTIFLFSNALPPT